MLPLAIGLGVLGFIAMRRAHRCHGGGGHHWRRHYGRGGFRAYMLRDLFERIDASPAQERAIIAELEKLQERARDTRFGVRDARGDLAAAMRGPVLDDAALGAVLGRVDHATATLRGSAIEALRNIHALLDDKQRTELAELIDRGWHTSFRASRRHHRGWGGDGHPYRM